MSNIELRPSGTTDSTVGANLSKETTAAKKQLIIRSAVTQRGHSREWLNFKILLLLLLLLLPPISKSLNK